MNQAFVYDAVRTPFGKSGSGLAAVRPEDLSSHVIKESVKRAPGLDPERINEAVFGNTILPQGSACCRSRMMCPIFQ